MKIQIPNCFTPRAYQLPFMRYIDGGGKRAVWVLHRRGGKDLTAMHQTCRMMHRRRGAYWHIFPTAEQGRKAIWEGFTSDGQRIMEQVFPRPIRKSPKEFLPKAETIVELRCGSIWRLLGSDNVEVVGAGPVGVVFSEYALAKPGAWNLIRPMLRENGGWAAFITTPRGANHAKQLYDMAGVEPGWWRDMKTLYDTKAFDPEMTIAAERREGMPEALIRQEYLCDWQAANVGAVFGDLVPEAQTFEHPADGIYTSWDLGISDATAIWFWRISGPSIDFIDHYEGSGKPFAHFADVLEEKGYKYTRHYLPHDARARTFTTGGTVLEHALERLRNVAITPSVSLADGIEAGRWLLQRGVRFHTRARDGIEALRAYHYEWDDERKTLARLPRHDWSSHSADAFRYAALVVKQTRLIDRPREAEKPPDVGPANRRWTLDELFTDNERGKRMGRI